MADRVLEIREIRKEHGALRPLRLRELDVEAGGTVALMGLDAAAAETFVNLVTGATLPDEGRILVFGLDTSAITDGDEWLKALDRFGILTDRAVLLDELTVGQNLAMTLTLAIDPIPEQARRQVERLAGEVGLPGDLLDRKVAAITALEKLRVRLGRAVALGPDLLLMEHPTATLTSAESAAFAGDLRRLGDARRLTMIAVTADAAFASAITSRVLTLQAATGALVPHDGSWGRVKRLLGL
jgi:ABC-type transporter Mla maintaining outer membrane lipid asymmetry ATPase subunit MlaF